LFTGSVRNSQIPYFRAKAHFIRLHSVTARHRCNFFTCIRNLYFKITNREDLVVFVCRYHIYRMPMDRRNIHFIYLFSLVLFAAHEILRLISCLPTPPVHSFNRQRNIQFLVIAVIALTQLLFLITHLVPPLRTTITLRHTSSNFHGYIFTGRDVIKEVSLRSLV
jgi:hypothetical protein